jgi:hypothetical protein
MFYAHIVNIGFPFGIYWQSGHYEIATISFALYLSMLGAILVQLFLLMYNLTLQDASKTSHYEGYLKAVWGVFFACLVVFGSLELWTLRTPAFDFWHFMFSFSASGFIFSVGFLALRAMDDVLHIGQGVLPDKFLLRTKIGWFIFFNVLGSPLTNVGRAVSGSAPLQWVTVCVLIVSTSLVPLGVASILKEVPTSYIAKQDESDGVSGLIKDSTCLVS